LAPLTLTKFYRCTIESILSGCITAWYGNHRALQRVVRSVQHITGGTLPALQDTTGLSRGWYGLSNTSLGAHCLVRQPQGSPEGGTVCPTHHWGLTAWYGNHRALQRVVQSVQHITGGTLPALQDTTAEDRSFHTLKLESLKLVFQPLHKFLVNKL
jgi:hypothetical protein